MHDLKYIKIFCDAEGEYVTDTKVTDTYSVFLSHLITSFWKTYRGALQEVNWWTLEKLRIKQCIKGCLSSGQIFICFREGS